MFISLRDRFVKPNNLIYFYVVGILSFDWIFILYVLPVLKKLFKIGHLTSFGMLPTKTCIPPLPGQPHNLILQLLIQWKRKKFLHTTVELINKFFGNTVVFDNYKSNV